MRWKSAAACSLGSVLFCHSQLADSSIFVVWHRIHAAARTPMCCLLQDPRVYRSHCHFRFVSSKSHWKTLLQRKYSVLIGLLKPTHVTCSAVFQNRRQFQSTETVSRETKCSAAHWRWQEVDFCLYIERYIRRAFCSADSSNCSRNNGELN